MGSSCSISSSYNASHNFSKHSRHGNNTNRVSETISSQSRGEVIEIMSVSSEEKISTSKAVSSVPSFQWLVSSPIVDIKEQKYYNGRKNRAVQKNATTNYNRGVYLNSWRHPAQIPKQHNDGIPSSCLYRTSAASDVSDHLSSRCRKDEKKNQCLGRIPSAMDEDEALIGFGVQKKVTFSKSYLWGKGVSFSVVG